MCGLVGLISRKPMGFHHADLELMQNLLLLDQIRGEDSTGVFTVMRDGNLTITKIGSHPMHLFATAAWGKHRSKAIQEGRIMIGHNRKATMGGINSMNAHPFHEDNIVLAHNGTVRGGHKKMADTEVDSHAVCHAFAEKGAEAVIAELDAAFAFIWWDIEAQRLFAVRNSERPLNIVTTEDYHILCSEPWMAEALLNREKKKVTATVEIPAGRLYEFQLGGSYSSREVTLKKPWTAGNGHWKHGQYVGDDGRFFDEGGDDLPGKSQVPSTTTKPTPNASQSGTELVVIPKADTQTPFEKAAHDLVNQPRSCDVNIVATPFVTNVNYSKGEDVLLKIYRAAHEPSKEKIRLSGTILEPGKPEMDWVGFIPGEASEQYVKDLMEGECMGTVRGFSRSTCGDSAWISHIEKASTTKVYNTDVPVKVWNYVCKEVMCAGCGSPIHSCEAGFTTVLKQRKNEYRVKCADCNETLIPEGELRNVFIQRRLDALQAAKSVSEESGSSPVNLTKEGGAPTVH